MDASVFERLLATEIGLNAMSLGSSAVTDAVRRRMADCGLADLAAYHLRLQTVPEELEMLVEAVVVAETWFFRDQEPFSFLARHVRSQWLPARATETLRVLSMPCSTGEEPYSIAIALQEAGLGPERYRIDAKDVSRVLLRKAETGVYGAYSFRGTPGDRDPRHFVPVPAGFSVRPEFRQSIRFSWGNLQNDDGFSGANRYDVVFCRNLMIYQHEAARRQIIDRLDRCLAPDGLLFVGHAEASLCFPKNYEPIRHPGAFAYRKAAVVAPEAVPDRGSASRRTPVACVTSPCGSQTRAPDEPLAATDCGSAVQQQRSGEAPPVVSEARALANQGRLTEAAALCERALRQQVQDAHLYCLLGVIRAREGQTDAAEALLNRALYLNAEDYEALLHLALLKAGRGEVSAAERLRQRAARVHERQVTAR